MNFFEFFKLGFGKGVMCWGEVVLGEMFVVRSCGSIYRLRSEGVWPVHLIWSSLSAADSCWRWRRPKKTVKKKWTSDGPRADITSFSSTLFLYHCEGAQHSVERAHAHAHN